MSTEENSNILLRQIRDLLVLQLRQLGVSPDAIGNLLKISSKSVQNRYPLRKGGSVEPENSATTGQDIVP